MKKILIYRPHDREPNHKPEWNAGLIIVEHKGKKHQFWSRTDAIRFAVDQSTDQEIIADYTHGY